jgi:hypothetical protein
MFFKQRVFKILEGKVPCGLHRMGPKSQVWKMAANGKKKSGGDPCVNTRVLLTTRILQVSL